MGAFRVAYMPSRVTESRLGASWRVLHEALLLSASVWHMRCRHFVSQEACVLFPCVGAVRAYL